MASTIKLEFNFLQKARGFELRQGWGQEQQPVEIVSTTVLRPQNHGKNGYLDGDPRLRVLAAYLYNSCHVALAFVSQRPVGHTGLSEYNME
jgi:hypothetical protein